MIYTNKKLSPVEVELDFGKITQIQVGEKGRGRKLIALTCPSDAVLNVGQNTNYTVGTTKSGKPRINKTSKNDPSEMYFLLSSQGGYTRRGDGEIFVNNDLIKQNNVELIAIGNGADGDAGRIGSWQTALLKVDISKNGCIAIRPGGAQYSFPIEYIVINDGNIYSATDETIRDLCDELDIDCPVIFKNDKRTFERFWNVANMKYAREQIMKDEIYDVDQMAISAEKLNAAFEYASKQDNFYRIEQAVKTLITHDKLSEETRRSILLNEELTKHLYHNNINKLLADSSLETQELFIKQKINILKDMIEKKSFKLNDFSFGNIDTPIINDSKMFNSVSFSDEERRLIAEYSRGKIKFTDPMLIILSAKNAEKDTQFEILSSIEDKEKYKELIRETTIGKIICFENEELNEIISQNPLLFKYVKEPNEKLYMSAIENLEIKNMTSYWNGEWYYGNNVDDILKSHPLHYIKNPNDEMIQAAVDKIPQSLSIIDVNEELQMKLISNNENLFKFFKTPSAKTQAYMADIYMEKENPLKKLEELNFQFNNMDVMMEKLLLNYIKNGKEQEIINYFQGYPSENMVICFENLRKTHPEKFNTIAKQINNISYNNIIFKMYDLHIKNIYNTVYSNNVANQISSEILNKFYDGVDLNFLSSVINITNNKNTDDILLGLKNNMSEKELNSIAEKGFYYTKAVEADPKNKSFITDIFETTYDIDKQKIFYECILFNTTNPMYAIDLNKATGYDEDYFERKTYSDVKLNAMLELAKHNVNPAIVEMISDHDKIKMAVEMIQNKTLDLSIFTKAELDAIRGGLTNFKNWHRTGGKTKLSDTFVISTSGDILPPDSNRLANNNHRYHYSTDQDCINHADGTQKWNNIPIDAVVITYSKENSRSFVDFEIKWMPQELTQQQKDTIKDILKKLCKCYDEINPNDLIDLLNKTEPSKLNGISLTELSQYSINIKGVNFDADLNTIIEQLNEIKKADIEASCDEITLPNQNKGDDAI